MTQTLNQPDHEPYTEQTADVSEPDHQPAVDQFDPELWVEAIKTISSHYRLEYSVESLRVAAAWAKDDAPIEVISRLAKHAGLFCAPGKVEKEQFSSWRLPAVVQFRNGHVAVVETQSSDGRLGLVYSGDNGLNNTMDCDDLLREVDSVVLLRPTRAISDSRVDEYVKPYEPHWFRKIVLRDMRPYGHVLLASLMANVLALAGILTSLTALNASQSSHPCEIMPILTACSASSLCAVF